ncbi:unnamed protein product [Blepharisma stoltei]|uniref:Uncharacterized protein n=1 Tax=Blepharisma stoltei TaxID=1481888 RepID=A0AAU9JFZ1_9CILI|nr:unnamed protein product [Blepharisma stoltei]
MQKYQEIESEWDYNLFDCDKNCPMCLFALIPGAGILMQAYNAEASDPSNPNACPTACLCGVIFCCIGSIYNSYNLAKNLHLKHSWVENIGISLLFCLDSCANTQEWMETMHKVKGNHKMTLCDYWDSQSPDQGPMI